MSALWWKSVEAHADWESLQRLSALGWVPCRASAQEMSCAGCALMVFCDSVMTGGSWQACKKLLCHALPHDPGLLGTLAALPPPVTGACLSELKTCSCAVRSSASSLGLLYTCVCARAL